MAEPGFWQAILGTGLGSSFLTFIGTTVQARRTLESTFSARVDKRLEELEAEVAECRRERPQMQILTMGLCMIVPELQRRDPKNAVIQQVSNAFSALPKETGTFDELLRKLDETPDTYDPTPPDAAQ